MLEPNLFILCPNRVQEETAKHSGGVSQGIFEIITITPHVTNSLIMVIIIVIMHQIRWLIKF
jgi:hypothetical protein